MELELVLGKTASGAPLIWKDPANGHLYMSGTSGSGKSYELKLLAPQLPGQGICTIIFDCSGDFLPHNGGNPPGWPTKDTRIINVRDPSICIEPFLPIIPGERPEEIADRMSDTLRTGLRLGDSQWAALSTLIEDGLKDGLLCTFDDLVAMAELAAHSNDAVKRMYPKLKKLNSTLPKGNTPLRWNLNQPGITILDLHNITDQAAQGILIELLLGTICSNRFAALPNEDHPVVLIFDECQRIHLHGNSYANRILREGRKFGLHGWFSTQWISHPEERKALDQAALRIYFQPSRTDLHRTVLSLGLKNRELIPRYEHRLSSFRPGEFLYRDNHQFRFNYPY